MTVEQLQHIIEYFSHNVNEKKLETVKMVDIKNLPGELKVK